MSRALTRLRVLWARARRLPRHVQGIALAFVVVIGALLAAFLAAGGGPLGGVRDFDAARASPDPYDGRSPSLPAAARERVLVQLPRPPLGALDGARGMSAREQRAYVVSLQDEEDALISALDARGVELADVVSFTRAWHGFAATVSAGDRPRLESLGVRVRPNRRLFPQLSEPLTVSPETVAPAAPARGAPTVALLAGGVAGAGGYDAIGRDRDPRGAREEVGGEPLAALLRAEGVRVRPIRVAGVRRISELVGSEELGTTDELLDGLEHALDPDGDGATDDRDAVAVIGVSAPYAGFADAPEAQAVRGARRLGTLVVASAGAEGPAAPGSSTTGSPGAAGAALTAGPLIEPDAVVRTTLTVGDVRVEGAAVLGRGTLRRPLRTAARPVEATTAATLLGGGQPPLQGRLAIVRAGANPAAQAAAAAAAGAGAVVLARPDGHPLAAMPAGRVPVPVLGVTGEGASALLDVDGDEPARTAGLRPPDAREGVPFGAGRSPFTSVPSTFAGRVVPRLLRPGSVLVGGRLVSGGAVAAAVLGAEAAKLTGSADARARRLEAAGNGPAPVPTRTPGAGGSPSPGATPGATPATPAAGPVAVGTPEVVRRDGATGVAFTVGTFERGDAAAGGRTTVVPAARLVLTLEREGGGRVERLTPTGGERGVLPGQYAYTLRAAVVRRLAAGRYVFRVRASAPGQATPTDAVSTAFEAG